MAIHTFVQWAFGFSYILFVATAARDQIHNILCFAVCVLSLALFFDLYPFIFISQINLASFTGSSATGKISRLVH